MWWREDCWFMKCFILYLIKFIFILVLCYEMFSFANINVKIDFAKYPTGFFYGRDQYFMFDPHISFSFQRSLTISLKIYHRGLRPRPRWNAGKNTVSMTRQLERKIEDLLKNYIVTWCSYLATKWNFTKKMPLCWPDFLWSGKT